MTITAGRTTTLEGAPVAWQDEITALDSAVATGQITAQEYRTARDALTARTGGAPAGGAVADPAGADPFPPPFRWGQPAPDATQVVRTPAATPLPGPSPAPSSPPAPAPPAPSPDATQVVPRTGRRRARPAGAPVPGPATEADATRVVRVRGSDSDRTQLVPGRRASVPGPGPVPPRSTAPPWLVQDVAGPGSREVQDPYDHDFFAPRPGRGRRLVLALLLLLVLAALVVGAVLLLTGGSDGGSGTDPTVRPSTTVVPFPFGR